MYMCAHACVLCVLVSMRMYICVYVACVGYMHTCVHMSYVHECGMVVCVHTNVDIHLYAYFYMSAYMWVQCCGAYVVYSIWPRVSRCVCGCT